MNKPDKTDFSFEGQMKAFKRAIVVAAAAFGIISALVIGAYSLMPASEKAEFLDNMGAIQQQKADEEAQEEGQISPDEPGSSYPGIQGDGEETPILDHPPNQEGIDVPEEEM